MKKISKILIMSIIVLTIVFGFISTSYAALNPLIGQIENKEKSVAEVENLGGNILGIVQTVGTVIAVAILVVLGIKYVMGSAEEKANYKKSMIPYIIGAFLVFATTTIVGVLFNAVNDIK